MRRPSLLLKILGLFLGLALVAAALAPWFLRRYLPPEKIRELLVAQAQKTLKREVRLTGVSWSLLKGLRLEGLAVSERPDFSAGSFASARSFNLKLRWSALLGRRVVVDSVALDGLRVAVLKGTDGLYNFSDLLASSTAQASMASAPAPLPFALDVSRAQVSDGELRYRDPAGGDDLKVSLSGAKVTDFRLSGAFPAEVSARAEGRWGGKPLEAGLSFSGELDLGGKDPAKAAVVLKKLSIEYGGVAAAASGRVQGLSNSKVELKLSLSERGSRRLEGDVSGSVSWPRGRAKAWPEVEASLKADIEPLKAADLPWARLPEGLSLPALALESKLGLKEESLKLESLRVKTQAGTAGASGTVSALRSAKPQADLDISLDLDLPELKSADLPWAKLPAGLVLPAAAVKAEAHLRGEDLKLSTLAVRTRAGTVRAWGLAFALASGKPRLDLEADLDLDLPELKAADLPWAKLPEGVSLPAAALKGKIGLREEDLSFSELAVKTKAGTVAVSGKVRRALGEKPEPQLEVKAALSLPALKSSEIPWGGLPPGLELPSSRWDGELSASLDEIRIPSLRLVMGRNDIALENSRVADLRGTPTLSLLAKCRSFVLEELTRISPETREMGLKGSGFFALGLSGKWPKPLMEGKLQFKGLGATVSGLSLSDFTGTASFDERKIDVPNLKGRLAEGSLEMDLTVKNYHAAPEIDLRAALTEFDLGKFLAAKAALASKGEAAPKPEAAKEPAAKRAPIAAKGRLTVGKLLHPNAEAKELRLEWDLSGIAPDMKSLDGWARLHMAGGRLSSLGKMATQSKVVKVLIFPLMIFQKIGSIGGIRLFPDFNNVSFSEIAGDYAFKGGLMTLRDSHLYSDAGNVTSKGEIDLPAEKLNLTVTAQVANIAPMDVDVGGTFSEPKSRLKVGKLVGEQAKQLVEPAKQLLENIFRKK